jgi:hypothetical protein
MKNQFIRATTWGCPYMGMTRLMVGRATILQGLSIDSVQGRPDSVPSKEGRIFDKQMPDLRLRYSLLIIWAELAMACSAGLAMTKK